MSRFGLNGYLDPLYRIVFASSRLHIVNYQADDGSWRAEWRPRYRSIGDKWILEKWISAPEYYGMSRTRWEREYPNLPWQARGEYEQVHTFETCSPADANLEKLIMWVNEGKKRSRQDVKDAVRGEYDQETKDTQNEVDARIRNCLPAFGTVPMAGYGGGRGTKTDAIMRSAEELQKKGYMVAHDGHKQGALPTGTAKTQFRGSGVSGSHWKVPVTA